MGKILKYCSSCEEGFAERFTFCPDCGGQLKAYELNPLNEKPAEDLPAPEAPAFIAANEEEELLDLGISEEPVVEPVSAEPAFLTDETVAGAEDDAPVEFEEPIRSTDEIEEELITSDVESGENIPLESILEPATIPAAGAYFQTEPMDADAPGGRTFSVQELSKEDDGYYITVLQERNGKQRNVLMFGAATLVLSLAIGGWGVSLFSKELGVGSIGDEQSLAFLIEPVPMTVEEEKQQKQDKDGGGGGGGGREEEKPVSQGDLANQSPNPIRPPDPRAHRMEKPELALPQPQTEGRRQFEQKYDRYGDPNARFGDLSAGPGTGGGMGSGAGTGQGTGRGTGTGSGTGSGSGSGTGTGDGPGTGSGAGDRPPPVRPTGPSSPLRILSQPRPGYTEAARREQIQGKVILRVTFLASGQIGSIQTVRGLPHGLTENAIAAARSMRFEPRMDNGQRMSVTRNVEYTFTIY
ncbi:MAG TPA: energy transducer TonB [Pyrinomonadaceae bacterium]|nr:energy transducer TonB [Pyrinomonadaceae bacterium]HMP66833.1 energy transducer TonB [Pyrinomonadaceae bacterium]